MSARIVPIIPAMRGRLRRDVLRWAAILGYSPEQSLTSDPDAVVNFLGACVERFPEFTHAHGSEIFRWHREVLGSLSDGPEAA